MKEKAKKLKLKKSIDFSTLSKISTSLILESTRNKAGYILYIHEISDKSYEIKPLIATLCKSFYIEFILGTLHEGKPAKEKKIIKEMTNETSSEEVVLFFMEYILLPEAKNNNKEAIEMLTYLAYYFESETRTKAHEYILKAGMTKNNTVVLKILENSFLLEKDPSFIHLLFKLDKGKAIEKCDSWGVIGSPQKKVEALNLIAKNKLNGIHYRNFLNHFKYWKDILSDEKNCNTIENRVLFYKLVLKAHNSNESWTGSGFETKRFKIDTSIALLQKVFDLEKSRKGFEVLCETIQKIDPENYQKIFCEYIVAITSKHRIYCYWEEDINKVLNKYDDEKLIKFYADILEKSIDSELLFKSICYLLEKCEKDELGRLVEKSLNHKERIRIIGQVVLQLKHGDIQLKEPGKKVDNDKIETLLNILQEKLNTTKNVKNKLAIIKCYVFEGKEDINRISLKELEALAQNTKTDEFQKVIHYILIIGYKFKALKADVDDTLNKIYTERKDDTLNLLFDIIEKCVEYTSLDKLYKPATDFLITLNTEKTFNFMKKMLEGNRRENSIYMSLRYFEALAITGDVEALKMVAEKEFILHSWIIPNTLKMIFEKTELSTVKTEVINEMNKRLKLAVLKESFLAQAISVSSEYKVVKELIPEYTSKQRKAIFDAIENIPKAHDITGSLFNLVEEIDTIMLSTEKQKIKTLLEKLSSECSKLDCLDAHGRVRKDYKKNLGKLVIEINKKLLQI